MAEMLLINPKSRGRRKTAKRKTVRRANPVAKRAAPKRRRRTYAKNPIAAVRRRMRRPAAAARRVGRRRRNPISMRSLNMRGISAMLKSALIGGAGAVGVDMLMAQLNKYLPVSMQPTAQPGLNNALKAALTVVLGTVLDKPTRGMASKAAAGALAVQAADVVRYTLAKFAPGSVPAVAGIGYYTPATVANRTARVGPVINGIGQFSRGGSPLLSQYTQGSPVLSGANGARTREMARR